MTDVFAVGYQHTATAQRFGSERVAGYRDHLAREHEDWLREQRRVLDRLAELSEEHGTWRACQLMNEQGWTA